MKPLNLIYIEKMYGPDKALDALFNYVDDLYIAGNFVEVDDFIIQAQADVELLSPVLMVGVMSITHMAKPKLTKRKDFVEACREKFIRTEGPARAKRLIAGFDK
jgi:hypothetical protein